MMSWKRAGVAAATLAAGAGLVMAVPVFACSEAPSISLNTLTAPAGSDVLLTGGAWWGSVPVTVHWDGLSGPVLAIVQPDHSGSLPPVTVHVPAAAEPGYHYLVATDNLYSADTARSGFQVTGANGVGAAPPQAILNGPSATESPSTVGVGVIALLAALGGAGLFVSTLGAAALVRSRRTATTVRVMQTPRHR